MRILLTGGFSGVGPLVCRKLYDMGFEVHVIDELTKESSKSARSNRKYYKKKTWAGISENDFFTDLANGFDCVVHLLEEKSAFTINDVDDSGIDGAWVTKCLLNAIRHSSPGAKLIYMSSAGVNGPTQKLIPPVDINTALNPVLKYAKGKAAAEKEIIACGIDFCILRVSEIFPSPGKFPDEMTGILFDHPLEARNEAITDIDAADAIAAAALDSLTTGNVLSKILYIAGGMEKGWQLINRELLSAVFGAMGIGMLDEECFIKDFSSYSMDWYDTLQSGELLGYKKHSFDDYIDMLRAHTEKGGAVMRLMAPRLKKNMESMSPYRRQE
ncbi:MAG: NAD(P)-dependent oxidoreductase [Clostridia bacterium]|nr:NAD(P)-dependent oxidoreductase [Clostridia bacterium]